MTGGSEVGEVAGGVVSSGAGITRDGAAVAGVDVDAGSSGAAFVVAAGGRAVLDLAALFVGACQPGITSSIPGRLLAGSELLLAVAISPTFT